ncbi:hypothetical protein ABIA38_004972 [Embleya sp. AB8]
MAGDIDTLCAVLVAALPGPVEDPVEGAQETRRTGRCGA